MEKLQFVLKSDSTAIINDEIYNGNSFDLLNKKYRFIISPKVEHWRFGIRLSETEEFEFSKTSRHGNPKYVDIHLAVGQFDGSTWRTPNDFKIGQYHLPPPLPHIVSEFDTYSPRTNIFWDIRYEEIESKLVLETKIGNKEMVGKLDIGKYKYFKIFAWADGVPFEISCDLNIYNQNEEVINYWILKINPDSYNIEEFEKEYPIMFGTHNTKFSKREEYELFFKVQRRDKVIGYALKDYSAVLCLFEVSKSVHSHLQHGESIELEITEMKDPPISIYSFSNKISSSLNSLLRDDIAIRLISIDHDIYETILSSEAGLKIINEENVNLSNDSTSKEDLLGRSPYVNALADYIERLWMFQINEAYTIHLSGEWGCGKTNTLDFLEQNLENKHNAKTQKKTNKAEWLVVRYNAWENQHIDPPWWVFMDNVYRNIQKKENWKVKIKNWGKENWWRAVAVNKLYWASFFLFAITTFILIWHFNLKAIWVNSERNTDTENVLKPIIALFSILGTLWLIFKGISKSLIPGSSEAALNFQKNIRDPMETVKKHFSKVAGYTNKNLAIFIDDIDRCNSESTVRLLEGIQTLFKSSKVLYVVSGDAAWIRKCFELQYEKFSPVIDKPGHGLGDFFLEKIFQMNTVVPSMSKSAIKTFWDSLIKKNEGIQEKSFAIEETELAMARKEFTEIKTEKEINEVVESRKGQTNEIYFRQAAVEKISNKEVIQSIKHRLEDYIIYLPANPRALKRLVNNYALSRQSLILQGTSLEDVNTDSLVRWLILNAKFPQFADKIAREPDRILSTEYSEVSGFSELVSNYLTPEIVKSIVGK